MSSTVFTSEIKPIPDTGCYFYLTPFIDLPYFKLGISENRSSLEARINQHDKTYGIDKEKTLIITSTHSAMVNLIEKEVKIRIPITQSVERKFSGIDGYTEVREKSAWDKVLAIISEKEIGATSFFAHKYTEREKPKFNGISRQKKQKQEKKKCLVDVCGKNIKAFCQKYKDQFCGYYFDKYKSLVFRFSPLTYEQTKEAWHESNSCISSCSSSWSVFAIITGTSYWNELKQLDINTFFENSNKLTDCQLNLYQDICCILNVTIDLSHKNEGYERDQERLKKLTEFFTLQKSQLTPVGAKIGNRKIALPIQKLFDGLLLVQNPGHGYYVLHYHNGNKKILSFASMPDGKCFTFAELRTYGIKNLKPLAGGVPKIISEGMYQYFFYLLHIHNISFVLETDDLDIEELLVDSYEPSEHFGTNRLNYLDLMKEPHGLWATVDRTLFPPTIQERSLYR